MRLFFDTCCLNRIWDDQSQMRIHLEAEAVLYLIDAARLGHIEMVTSDYLLAKIFCQPDTLRCIDVMNLTSSASFHVPQDPVIEARAQKLSIFHIKGNDALHIAAAEVSQCDYFITTDDRLLKRCHKAFDRSAISIQVLNPTEIMLP